MQQSPTQRLPDAGLDTDLDAALNSVARPIADAAGMPNMVYTEPRFHQFERDHLFAKTWTALAFCDDHSEAGAFAPVDFMGLPLLIVRDKDGALSVFHNVCSHRGMRLVTAPGRSNGLLVCPYHAWSYDLSGALQATPHIGGVGAHKAEGFCREKHGLKAVRSHCWMGILFINLSGDAPEFDAYAAPLTARYREFIGADGAASLAPAHADDGMSLQANCNWKLAVENYCEAYHLPWVHPTLNAYSPLEQHYCMLISDDFAGQGTNTFNPSFDTEVTEANGAGKGKKNNAAPLPVFPQWPEDKHEIAEYPTFYPNLLLGFQVNHFYAMIIHPVAADHIREDVRLFYVGEGAADKRHLPARRANLAAWQRIFAEDIDAVEGMQAGRRSPGFQGGVFSPVMDGPTHHFHKWVARKYRAARARGKAAE